MGQGQGLKYSTMSASQGMETIGKKYTQEFETNKYLFKYVVFF